MSKPSKTSALKLRALLSCSVLVLAAAPHIANAACTPNPPLDNTTTTCTGTDSSGVTVSTWGTTVNVQSGATLSAPNASTSALTMTTGGSIYTGYIFYNSTVNNSGAIDGGSQAGVLVTTSSGAYTLTATVNNNAGGTLTGLYGVEMNPARGPYGDQSALTVDNRGTITGTSGYAIYQPSGGGGVVSVTNEAGGTIGAISASNLTVSNSGTIDGGANSAIASLYATTVTNAAGGLITNNSSQATISLSSGALTNKGTITNSGTGLAIASSGSMTLTNNGGVVNGNVVVGPSSTIDNSGGGRINGNVTFGTGTNRLITDIGNAVNPMTGITGSVTAAAGSTNTLQLDATSNATLTAQPTLPAGFQNLTYGIGGGATLTVDASVTLTSTVNLAAISGSGTFVNNGTITTTGAAIAPDGMNFYTSGPAVINNGTITATLTSGSYAISQGIYGLGAITNTGTITAIGGGGINTTMYGTAVNNSGTITADETALYSFDGVVSNSGTIHSNNGVGAYLFGNQGMPATNTSTGVIYGKTIGVDVEGYTLTNYGTITSPGVGVYVSTYSGLINQAGGVINGDVGVTGNGFTWDTFIQNAGTINGNVNFGAGVGGYGDYGSSFANQAGGVVNGQVSIGGMSMTNAGTINGGGGDSVVFLGGASSLTLQTGSTLIGDAVGSTASGATNALILQGQGEADNNFLNFNTLNMQGTGTWTLGGTSTIGATEVSSGTLVVTGALSSAFSIDAGATLQGSTSTLLAQGGVTDNGTLAFDQATAGEFDNAITGTGALIKQNAGTLTLGGASSLATTEVAGGTLVVTGSLTSAFTIDAGATLQGSTSTLLAQGGVTDNGTLVFDQTATGTFANTITGTGGVTVASGSVSLSNSGDAYTGATHINSGATLALTGQGSIAASSGVTANGTFDISGATAGASITTLTGSGKVDLGAQTLTLTHASGTFSGVIADGGLGGGTGGGVTIADGTVTLTGANTYTGTTSIGSGATLQLGNAGTTGSVAGNIVDNGLLQFNYSGQVRVSNYITGSGSVEIVAGDVIVPHLDSGFMSFVGGAVTIDKGATLEWGDGTNPGLLADTSGGVLDNGALVINLGAGHALGSTFPISGSGDVRVESGTFIEYGAATYTGTTTIDSGATIQLVGAGSIAASSVTDNGTLDVSLTASGTSIGGLGGSGFVVLGAKSLTLTNASSTFSGVISGSGGLTIAGGTEILTGINTYGGGSTIEAGATLQLGDGVRTGEVAGAIVDDGTLTLDLPTGTFANAVNGTGVLVKQGAGVLTLSGSSNVGSTTVASGTLVVTGSLSSAFTINSGATLQGSSSTLLAQGTVTDNGALVFDQAVDGEFGNAISGSGSLSKQNAGALTLSGTSSVGSTTVKAGSLIVTGSLTSPFTVAAGATLQGSSASLHGTIADAGTVVFDQASDGTFANAITGAGTLVKQNAGTLTLSATSSVGSTEVAGGKLVVAGPLTSAFKIDAGATLQGSTATLLAQGDVVDNGTLVFDQATNATFANAITGSGALIKQNAGTLVLDGVSSVATTTVNGGVLAVGDAAHADAKLTSSVTVNAGGTLIGHGAVVGDITNNGGVVQPGGSIGVLTVNGNYTQTAGSLSLEVTPLQNSHLVVNGTATLAGSLQLVADPGIYRKGTAFDVVDAQAISGGFSSVSATNGMQVSALVKASELVATVTQGVAPLAAGYTANERAIANAFIGYPVGTSDFDPVANAIVGMSAGTQQNAAFDKLGGEVYADLLTAGRDSARTFLGGLSDQLAADATVGGGAGKGTALWGRVFGTFGSVDGGEGAHGVSNNAGGVIFGVERAFGADTQLGVSATYGRTDLSLKGLSQSGNLDTGAAALYGERRWGMVFVDAALAYDYDHGQGQRTIALPGVASRKATSGFSGDALSALVQAGVRFDRGGFRWEPSVGVLYSQVQQDGFTESGAGGADLAVKSQSLSASESLAGVRVSRTFSLSGGALKLDGRLAWAHELGDVNPIIGESFAAASGTNFVLGGAKLSADNGIVGAGLSYERASNLSFYVRYDGKVGQSETQSAVTLGARFAW